MGKGNYKAILEYVRVLTHYSYPFPENQGKAFRLVT
jgi:hypothetical protein